MAASTIRVVLYQQGNTWIAQSLEYDLSAQGKSINVAMRRWIDTLIDACEYTMAKFGKPLDGIKEAPARFHQMFDEVDDDHVDFEPRVEMRTTTPPPHIAARILEAA